MKLRVLSPYRAGRESYATGDIITMSEERAAYLMRDAPGVFIEHVPEPPAAAVAPDKPAADKAVRVPRRK